MAAETAAGLVSIRSITYRSAEGLAKGPRVLSMSTDGQNGGQRIVYQEGNDPGPVCNRLLGLLRGIQFGKVKPLAALEDWLLDVTALRVADNGEIREDEEVVARLADDNS